MEMVLEKMGFHDRWVKLMMVCIITASYSILINGEPHGEITPTRGLRQGDPLSPYLFLMCTKGLHGLISKAANDGDIKGVSICRNGPKLAHLLFADLVKVNAKACLISLKNMKEPPVNKSIEQRPLCFSASPQMI